MMAAALTPVAMFALPGLPDVAQGDDLGRLIVDAMAAAGESWQDGDIVVVAQKIVSKAEGRVRILSEIKPSARAHEVAAQCGKDPRKVQAVLDESIEIVKAAPVGRTGLLITRHRNGWVCANAGIDESNLGRIEDGLLLLPEDADASARAIADTIEARAGLRPGVVITDTFGRPWRKGLVNVAIGLDRVPPIIDLVGTEDAYGRQLEISQEAFADAIAAAAGLLMVKDAARPVIIMRGLAWPPTIGAAATDYVRPPNEDVFR